MVSFSGFGIGEPSMGTIPRFEFVRFLGKHFGAYAQHFYLDDKKCWYHQGIAGLSTNIPETVAYLASVIRPYTDVTFLGSSAGGYAALLFGSLLNVTRVIAFKPQTNLHYLRPMGVDMDTPYADLRPYLNTTTLYYLFGDVTAQDPLHHVRHCRHVEGPPNVVVNTAYEVDLRKMRDEGHLATILHGVMTTTLPKRVAPLADTLAETLGDDERQLHVYAVASDVTLARALMTTAHRAGLTVHLDLITWTDYSDKLRAFKRLLASDDIDPEDVVVFVDAYDVLCYAPAVEILRKYDAMGCDLVLSGELNCFPEELADAYAMLPPLTTRTRYTFVNSGGMVGTKAALLHLLNWKTPEVQAVMSTSENGTDQHYVASYYLAHHPGGGYRRFTVKLDTEQEIFQCMFRVDVSECSFREGRFHNDVLSTRPCFVHFNGYNAMNKFFMRSSCATE